VFLIYFFCKL